MDWFKVHTEARNDAKLRSLSDSQHRVWFNLLCFAAEQEERGTIGGYEDALLSVEVAGSDVALLEETLQALVQLRIVARNKMSITFINFDKRQYNKPSDNREQTRLRKQRQREKEACRANVTPCHARKGVTGRDACDMSQKTGSSDAVLAARKDRKTDRSKKDEAVKHSEDPEDRNGHAYVTPMSRPVTQSHAIDTDTEVIAKHLSKANTSVKKNSASPGEEPQNASQIPTLSAPDGAVLARVLLHEEDAPSGECEQKEPMGNTPSPDRSITVENLLEAGTPGMGSIEGGHHPDACLDAFADSHLPAVALGDQATGVTPPSQDALSASKLPDQIAIEGLSPCSPHSTTHPDAEGLKTAFGEPGKPEHRKHSEDEPSEPNRSDPENHPAGSSAVLLSGNASPSSKLPDEIAVEESSPRPPYPTIHPDDDGPETAVIGLSPDASSLPDDASEQPASPELEEETVGKPDGRYPVDKPAEEPVSPDEKPEPTFYLTKRKRKLSGWKLETFNEFMDTYAYKKNRAEAADAWLDIPNLTPEFARRIIEAAKMEVQARQALLDKNLSPKYPSGWLSCRRWEDWEQDARITEENHGKESQCRQEESEYGQSIRDALKRFM